MKALLHSQGLTSFDCGELCLFLLYLFLHAFSYRLYKHGHPTKMTEETNLTPGAFIVIDGVDGSGKTTVLADIKKRLEITGRPIKQFRIIGEGVFGAKMRDIVLNFKEERPVPASELLAFLSAINQCYAAHIAPWVASGGIAIVDRWLYTTYVYQGIAASLKEKDAGITYQRIESLLQLLPPPNMSIILDVDKENVFANLAKRSQSEAQNDLDKFCSENMETMIEKYRNLRAGFPSHWIVYLDNNPPYPRQYWSQDLDYLVDKINTLLKE